MSFHKTIVLPDIHTPAHDKDALKAILDFIKYYKPNRIIQLGDFCDWDSLSHYEPRVDSDIRLIDREIAESNEVLDQIDSSLPKKCEKYMLGGNHEQRYQTFRLNHGFEVAFRRMKDMTSWQEEYNLKKRGWQSREYGEWLELGKIIFVHGWYASTNSADRMLRCFCKNIIFGHTHQHLVASMMDSDHNPIEAESIGTLSRFNLSYLQGKPPVNWIHGFLYIDTMSDGTFTKNFVRVINGRFIQHNKYFGRT